MASWAAALTITGLLFVTLGTGMQAVTANTSIGASGNGGVENIRHEFSRQIHPSHYGGGHAVLESVALWLTQRLEPVATVGCGTSWALLVPTAYEQRVTDGRGEELANVQKQAASWTLSCSAPSRD